MCSHGKAQRIGGLKRRAFCRCLQYLVHAMFMSHMLLRVLLLSLLAAAVSGMFPAHGNDSVRSQLYRPNGNNVPLQNGGCTQGPKNPGGGGPAKEGGEGGFGLVWFGSTPPPDDQAHGQRNRPCATRLGWALPAVAVSRRAGLLTAPEPRGGTRGREIPPCLCVWCARRWGAFGSGGGGGRAMCVWGDLSPGAPGAGREAVGA